MEVWIWVIALVLGALIPVIAVTFLATKALRLGNKLAPLASDVKLLQQAVKDNPEAVKFFSDASQATNKPEKTGPR
jgi:hypothetical protein